MKFIGKVMGSYAVLAAAVLLGFAGVARAQVETYRGSFTTTHQLHWGQMTLEPGDYSLQVSSGGAPMVTVSTKDGKGKGFVVPLGVSQCPRVEDAALLVAIAGRARTVYSLRLPEQGIELSFRPDLKREMQRAEQARSHETLPVVVAKR